MYLELFQEYVDEENGEILSLDTKVVESELDSFGVTMVLFSIEADYPWLPDGTFASIIVEEIIWQEVADYIEARKLV